MYIFQLMGGLGNQMFQYAAARALAERKHVEVKLDFDCPYQHVKYSYNLDVFNIKTGIATVRDLWKSKPKHKFAKLFFMLLGKDPNLKLYSEKKDFQYDPQLFTLPDGSYLQGFWQTEKYFKGIEPLIREDFTFRVPLSGRNLELSIMIRRQQAISLHIRRGDYVKIAQTNNLHGVCSPEYYQLAIDYMTAQIPDAVFYIFSDDMEWVKNNFNLNNQHVYVDNNDAKTNFEDLRLMSLCKHHIIANSSFSWWGAWLNPSDEKIVIAPKRWMRDINFETRDLIPANWIKL